MRAQAIHLGTSINRAKAAANPHVPRVVRNAMARSQPEVDYNTLVLNEEDDIWQAKKERMLAQTIGTVLIRKYPGRQWGVQVDLTGGMMNIQCPSLSLEKAYYVSLAGRTVHDLEKRATKAAGQILERYGLSRNKNFDPDIIETLDRNYKDEVVSIDAAPVSISEKVKL